jgi:hypothetical protein
MNIYYKHAEELVKNTSDLQRRVLISCYECRRQNQRAERAEIIKNTSEA